MSIDPSTSFQKAIRHGVAGLSVPELLAAHATTRPQAPFLTFAPFDMEPATLNYGAFAHQARCLARGLRDYGMSPGDRLVIHLDNCPELLLAWHACLMIGAVAVLTNTRSSADELCYFVTKSGARAAITQPALLETMQTAGDNLDWIGCIDHDAGQPSAAMVGQPYIAFATLIAAKPLDLFQRVDPFDIASIQFTSGTTSRPKGVVWTHANCTYAARANAQICRIDQNDVGLAFLPLFHTNALSYSHLGTLWAGAELVIQPRFSASRFWEVATRHRCSWAIHIGFSLHALASLPMPADHRFTRWGLGAVDPPLVAALWKISCIGWFGMTETVTLPLASELGLPAQSMSIGRARPGYQVDVRDEGGMAVAPGGTGLLWIKGEPGVSLFAGYLDDVEATARAFDAEGWFATGDTVALNADGTLSYIGRFDERMRVGGENVAEAEVERAIATFPGVIEVAVVGRPDPMLDEVPIAYVRCLATEDDLAQRMIDHCATRLAAFKVPRGVILVDDFPRATIGKIDKKPLRAEQSARAEANASKE
jgi:carnitine-CoA ligase